MENTFIRLGADDTGDELYPAFFFQFKEGSRRLRATKFTVDGDRQRWFADNINVVVDREINFKSKNAVKKAVAKYCSETYGVVRRLEEL